MNRHFGLPNAAAEKRLIRKEAEGWLPRGWIDGLTLSNDTTDATNDIAIAAGVARSTVRIVDGAASNLSRDQIDLELPVGVIKQLDVAFAPANYDPEGYSEGGRSGGKSSSSISDTTWHVLLVGGAGLQTDVVLHDSATQSSILAEMQKIGGYTAYRNIGSIPRESSALIGFKQHQNRFRRTVMVSSVSVANPGTSAVTRTLNVPIGLEVIAEIAVSLSNSTSPAIQLLLSALDEVDTAPSGSVYSIIVSAGAAYTGAGQFQIKTNTSGQIRSRLSASGASDALNISTVGWIHPRGQNS